MSILEKYTYNASMDVELLIMSNEHILPLKKEKNSQRGLLSIYST